MVKHYIIMSSSYTEGKRIALDITDEAMFRNGVAEGMVTEIQAICGQDVPLSTHLVQTESPDWRSVQEYDSFFADVVCAENVEEFCRIIQRDRVLSGTDVAAYILSRIKCTHLSLEKLVYFAYADYLCLSSKRLFEDKIYAFTYGPVVDSVYKIYKGSGHSYVEADTKNGLRTDIAPMPAKSRILFAEDGLRKLQSIDKTIEAYGGMSAKELVARTHRDGAPWSRVDSEKAYQVIPDALILACHARECEG